MRILVLVSVCLCLALAEDKLLTKEKRLMSLLTALLDKKNEGTIAKKEEAGCAPLQTTMFAGLDLKGACPEPPTADMVGKFDKPVGPDGVTKLDGPVDITSLLDDIESAANDLTDASKESIIGLLQSVYQKYLEPFEKKMERYFQAAGFTLFRAAIAGTDVPGAVNEDGCFKSGSFDRDAIVCALTKSLLLEEALRIWMEGAFVAIQPQLTSCETLYYLPYMGEYLDMATLKWAFDDHMECVRNNTEVILAAGEQASDPNAPIMTKLMTGFVDQMNLAGTMYELIYAGGYVIGELKKEESGSGSGYNKRDFGSGAGGSGYEGSGNNKRDIGSGDGGSGYEGSGAGNYKRSAIQTLKRRTAHLNEMVTSLAKNVEEQIRGQVRSLGFANMKRGFQSRQDFTSELEA